MSSHPPPSPLPPSDAARPTELDLGELVDQLPGIVYRCEARLPWRMHFISAQAEGLTGYPPADFLEERVSWASLVHPDDVEALARKLDEALSVGRRFVLDYRIVDRSGAVRWVKEQGLFVGDGADGTMLEGFIQDVSEDRRNVSALKAGEARLATVFDQALVGILHRDKNDRLLHVNKAFCDMVGRRPDELDGLPISALWHPEDAAALGEQVARHVAKGEPYSAERRYVRPDGSIVWGEVQVSFVRDEHGAVESSISVMLDTTRRRQVEAQRSEANEMLEMALAGAAAGTFELSLEDYSLRLSPRAARICGLPEDHDGHLAHDQWRDLIEADDAAKPLAALTDGSPARAFEVRLSAPRGGRVRWLRALSNPTSSADRESGRLFGLLFDDTDRKEAEQRLRASEAHLRLVQEAARIGSYQADAQVNSVCSEQFYRNLGLREDMPSLPQAAYLALIHPEDRQRIVDECESAIAAGADGHEGEFRIIRASDGEQRWMFNRTRYQRDGNGRVTGAIGVHMDVTDRKRAEEAARAGEALNLSIIQASADGITLLDPSGRITFMNSHALAALGADDMAALADRPWTQSWPAASVPALEAALDEARAGGVGRFTGCCGTSGGDERWWDIAVTPVGGEGGLPSALLAISRDVTEQRRSVERVRWAASHDALTGLPNRHVFQERLDAALADARAEGRQIGLLVLDIDHFKEVNDERGHDAGDALLKTFSERLRRAVRGSDFVARLGGDEFAVILKDLTGADALDARVAPVLECLQRPISHAGRSIDCRASAGAALYPIQGATPDELMKNADLALYAAKLSRRGGVTLFASAMRSDMQNRLSMLNLARDALREALILPHYQPQVDLRTGALIGFEALLRWRHPKLGIQVPASIAEAFGDVALARQLGQRMQEQVFADIAAWLAAGVAFGRVSINTSAAEFRGDDFAESLLERLEHAGIPHRHVEVEITEKTVFQGKNSEYAARALGVLRAHRVRVALDDFGTGFSSLSHLKQFAVDALKIDQSFIRGLGGELGSDDDAIVLAVLNLGRSLNIDVVAEGVETETQARFLRAHGCRIGQGYLFGRAMEAGEVPALLEAADRKAG